MSKIKKIICISILFIICIFGLTILSFGELGNLQDQYYLKVEGKELDVGDTVILRRPFDASKRLMCIQYYQHLGSAGKYKVAAKVDILGNVIRTIKPIENIGENATINKHNRKIILHSFTGTKTKG